MQPIDIVILTSAIAVLGGVTAWIIVRKKKGKSVGCDCSSCEGCCNGCPSARNRQKREEKN